MILINRMFTGDHFSSGYTNYQRPGLIRQATFRPATVRRTSRVRFEEPSPDRRRTTRRRSKTKTKTKRSPRTSLIRHLKKGFKRASRRKYTNEYARNISEFADATWPFIFPLVAFWIKTQLPSSTNTNPVSTSSSLF
jgi:hypothetical protein